MVPMGGVNEFCLILVMFHYICLIIKVFSINLQRLTGMNSLDGSINFYYCRFLQGRLHR